MSKNKDFESKINYYKNYTENIKFYPHTHIYSDNIYWCWFKGLEKAPKLYQAAYFSVKNNCNKHNIIIIIFYIANMNIKLFM